ncbi:hypothetical protein GGI04_004943 [Coemansia thaxteri]|nr:hypothetical protein GGI04_004943 [Coemansia thaxteri]
MDTETSYWDQYDAEEAHFDARLEPVLQPPEEPQYVASLGTHSASSRDSYWSRYLGAPTTGSTDQCTPGDSARLSPAQRTPLSSHSTDLKRRLLVVPDKLAALSLAGFCHADTAEEGCFADIASSASSDSGCDVNEHAQIVADSTDGQHCGSRKDDATLVVVTAPTPSAMQKPENDVGGNRHHGAKAASVPSLAAAISTTGAAGGHSQSAVNHRLPASPPSSPGLSVGGVNPTALITRLSFLKAEMDEAELLLLLPPARPPSFVA